MLFKVTTLILDALLYPGSECHAGGDDIVFRDALPGLDDGGLRALTLLWALIRALAWTAVQMEKSKGLRTGELGAKSPFSRNFEDSQRVMFEFTSRYGKDLRLARIHKQPKDHKQTQSRAYVILQNVNVLFESILMPESIKTCGIFSPSEQISPNIMIEVWCLVWPIILKCSETPLTLRLLI